MLNMLVLYSLLFNVREEILISKSRQGAEADTAFPTLKYYSLDNDYQIFLISLFIRKILTYDNDRQKINIIKNFYKSFFPILNYC